MKKFTFIKLSFVCLVLSIIFLPKDTKAISFTNGAVEGRIRTGDNNNGIIYGNSLQRDYITYSFNNGFPQNNYLEAANQNGSYYFITSMSFYGNIDEGLQTGYKYTFKFNFNYGSYITWTNYYGWSRLIANRNLEQCNGNTDTNACTINWEPSNNGTSSTLTLTYVPTQNAQGFSFVVGSQEVNSQKFIFWNRLGSNQNFNLVSYSISKEAWGINNDINEGINEINDNLDNVNDNLESIGDDLTDINSAITDDNVDSSSNHFDDEFGGGSWGPPPQNTSPLATIVNLPLQYLRTITSNTTCSNLNLTIPYLNTNISIPCITSYLSSNFSSGVVSLVQLIVNALVIYKVGVSFWEFLHNLRDPHSDDLEVVDL